MCAIDYQMNICSDISYVSFKTPNLINAQLHNIIYTFPHVL